jgi:hypothetical protein
LTLRVDLFAVFVLGKRAGPSLLSRFAFRERVRSSERCRSDIQQINSSGWE